MTAVEEVGALRAQMVAASRAVMRSGAISRSNHGNMSLLVPGTQTFLLTAVSSLEEVGMDDLPLVDFHGRVLDGVLHPTSAEIVDMHAIIYKKNPEMRATIHTHAPNATAYAIANKSIECWYEGLARFGLTDPIPVAGYAPRGSKESVSNIADVLKDTSRGVLLQNHGVLAFERDLMAAVRVLTMMEEAAEMGLRAALIGGPTLISNSLADYAQRRAREFAEQGALGAEIHHNHP